MCSSDLEWLRFKLLYFEATSWMHSNWRDRDLLPLTEGGGGGSLMPVILVYWRLQPSGEYWWGLRISSLSDPFVTEVDICFARLQAKEGLPVDPSMLWMPETDIQLIRQSQEN